MSKHKPLIQHIQPYVYVAASAWGSQIIIVVVQMASIRILTTSLGINKYAVFTLLVGLANWFLLADMGLGTSLQNYISEKRAQEKSYDDYIAATASMLSVLLILAFTLLYFYSPHIAPLFLKQFLFLNNDEIVRLFFLSGIILVSITIGKTSYKIWYAEQKGYLGNILLAIGAIIGYAGIIVVNRSITSNNLLFSLLAFLVPQAALSLIAFFLQIQNNLKSREILLERVIYFKILKRAGKFWGFSIMAAFVLQIDYIVLSQYVPPQDIVAYTLTKQVFTFPLLAYTAILSALWPVFSEVIAKNNWDIVVRKIQKYLWLGLGGMFIYAVLLVQFMPTIVNILAPEKNIFIPATFILLLGFYYMLRIWTDTFAMILQSASKLKVLWISVLIQAIISISLQFMFVHQWGLYGVAFGLIASFSLTVAWTLPTAVLKNYRMSQGMHLYEH